MCYNKNVYNLICCSLVILVTSLAVHGQSVIINELMAINKNSIADGFGEHEDWLELYNTGKDPINIGGMFLSDEINNPTKYQIPPNKPKWTTIQPKETMVLWVDSDDEQGTRHLSFRLDADGGSIAIYAADTQLLDVVNYPQQYKDISFGREPDASAQMCFFNNPTPDGPNLGGVKLLEDDVLPEMSIPGGFYNKSISIELSSRHKGQIYYTIDGSDPSDLNGISYVSPISIDSTTIIRARIIREGYFPGHIVTKSYFINEFSTLPVISLTTDPVNLWDRSTGIYHKYKKRGWERPANVEYFDLNEQGLFFPAFNNRVAIRIAGKTSRRQPKKSFVLHTKDQYGNPRINYKVFKDKPIESFASLWLRSDATSGRNVPELWVGERFKNELLYEVNKEMGSTVDMQAYQPVLLFLNGEYWGLYNLMERKGADFIKDNHGYEDVDILTGEYERVVKGRSAYYDKLTRFVSKNDIKNDSIYEEVGLMMDLLNYMDYWIYEVYSSTHDNRVNIRYWRPKGEGHKWRWISYDQDSWNTYDENSLERFIGIGDVFLLFQLMKNETFKTDWANRMCDYLNTSLKSDNVINLVDEITGRIADELLREKERWQDTMLYMPSNSRIEWFVEYAVQRPCHIRSQIMKFYGLEGNEVQLRVNVKNGNGTVKINTIFINEFPWTGYYLENLPITVTAIPAPGYKFSRWIGNDLPKEPKVQIAPYENQEFVPVFKKKILFSDNLRVNVKK